MGTMSLRSLPSQAKMIDNILASWDSATEADIAEFSTWYDGARNICSSIAKTYNLQSLCVAGAMAWLSPQTSFAQNVADLHTLCDAVHNGRDPFGEGIGNYADNILKAEQCPAGNFASMVITPQTRALKVRSFFRNIIGLGDPFTVTIDRHAVAIAVGNYNKAHNGRYVTVAQPEGAAYRAVQDAYIKAAQARNVTPKVMQAVCWCVRRGTGE